MENKVNPVPEKRSLSPEELGRKILDFWTYIKSLFDLQEGKVDDLVTIEDIRKNVEFKGANLYILIFAILVASVGLNVNSTAVVIGAMLISPLMGPIMGMGLAAGINDFDLLKKSLKNIGLASLISILTSSLYFFFTPLDIAQSELLARTEPSIWDVLIALFGGLAGIVAGSRKEKSNAIPGVAIATALMPPLCTAGYGIATGNLAYFFGAFYLFFINSVFISLSTYLIVRFMRFPKREFLDPLREKRVRTYITVFIIVTIAPSIYLAYNIVTRTLWEESVNQYLRVEFDMPGTQIISSELTFLPDSSVVEVTLIGEKLSSSNIQQLKNKLTVYGLDETHLYINQSTETTPDMTVLRSDILKDLYERSEATIIEKDQQINLLRSELNKYTEAIDLIPDVAQEAKINHPTLEKFTMGRNLLVDIGANQQETVLMAYAQFSAAPEAEELNRLESWLKIRTKAQQINLIIDFPQELD
ncbi:MAG: TIGR00341 family protein [Saprospiraceae bacterium]